MYEKFISKNRLRTEYDDASIKNMNNPRMILPDVLKGIVIILVVFGHCIQEGSGLYFSDNQLYFDDNVYQWIYSFHMPLFMLISGFFSYKKLNHVEDKKEYVDNLIKRTKKLWIPIFFWAVMDETRIGILNSSLGYHQKLVDIGKHFFTNLFTSLWFLWAVWIAFFVVWVINYTMKQTQYKVVSYVILSAIMFMSPDGLGLGVHKYMFPYFIIGYKGYELWKKYKENMDVNKKIFFFILSSFLFVLLFSNFSKEWFIYLSGFKLYGKDILTQFKIDIFRFLLGLSGSMSSIVFLNMILGEEKIKNIKVTKLLIYLGRRSMAIYILSGYFIIFLIKPHFIPIDNLYLTNIIETIVVIVLSVVLICIFEKNKYLKYIIGLNN